MATFGYISRKQAGALPRRTRRQGDDTPKPAHRLVLGYVVALAAGAGLGVAVYVALHPARPPVSTPSAQPPKTPASYYELLAMPPDELAKVDLAAMNLVCAKGLPGTEDLDIPAALAKLDVWARKVRTETERHLYRLNDPRYADHYQRSEARLRSEFLVQVLQEDCAVRYNPARIRDVDFSRPQDLFIHGLINSDNGGTCSSMPVLYATVGRRLGYPLKLVLAKQHIFCRWDDGKERLNIEGAGNGGVEFFPDEHYRTWPLPITDAEMASGEFLRSLTPPEELASFLLQRSCCWRAHRRAAEERVCLAEALRLMPRSLTLEGALRSTFVMNTKAVQRMEPWNDPNLPLDVRRQRAPPAGSVPGVPYNASGNVR